MRVPIPLCKILGNTTAEYRWFAALYLIGMFLVLPLSVMVSYWSTQGNIYNESECYFASTILQYIYVKNSLTIPIQLNQMCLAVFSIPGPIHQYHRALCLWDPHPHPLHLCCCGEHHAEKGAKVPPRDTKDLGLPATTTPFPGTI